MGSYSSYTLAYMARDKRSLNIASFRPLTLDTLSEECEDNKQLVFSDFHPSSLILYLPQENDQISWIPINSLGKYSTRSISLNRSSRCEVIYLLEDISDFLY